MRDPSQFLLIFIIFLSLTLYQMIVLASSSTPPPQADTHPQCLDHQRSALSLLHHNLMIMGDYSPDDELQDWDLKTDCCSWDGVACNGDGLVTELDLSPPVSATLKLENPVLEMVFQNLSFLVKVNLDYVDLSAQSSSWCEAISHLLPNLRVLSLSDCALSGPICSSLFTLPSLKELYLVSNKFSGELNEFPNASSSLLEILDLSYNRLEGPIPRSIIFELSKLVEVYLSSNRFSRELREFPNASSSLLEVLDLSHNRFEGPIPRSIFELPSLVAVDLSSNKFYGSLKLGKFQNQRNLTTLGLSGVSIETDNTSLASVQLEALTLTSCNLTEFPNFLKAQNSLLLLDLSNNRIKGSVPSWIWKRNLNTLDLSGNPIDFPKYPPFCTLNNSRSIFNCDATSSFPQLLVLRMRSCGLSSFPEFLKNQSNIERLDLSDNKLSGQIPNWIWNITSLWRLNLSENSLHSFDQISPAAIPAVSLQILDLRDNLLHGSFPKAICNFSALRLLDMSYNQLRSHIPDCLEDIQHLNVLHLQRNNYTSMPGFSQAGYLQSLKINDNKIEGKLPRSLANCSKLEVLDLGDNMIRDAFPFWLEKLPALKILVQRANKFYGQIGNPGPVNIMPMLLVLDLSSNEFTGHLSKEFVQSLAAMQVTRNNESVPTYVGDNPYNYNYEESVTIMDKGLEMPMERIPTVFTCLDLSQNRFYGEIPEEISYLKSLKVLNLSHNSFISKIPSLMRNLTELESLDLSNNKLSGEIPLQLIGLTFLAVMNLSHNQLEGSIPQGNQFGTFPNTSYEGNPRLCGPPLTRKCGVGAVPMPPPVVANDEDSWTKYILDWKIVGMGYASAVVIGFSIGYTIFSQMRIKWFSDLERRARKHGRRFRQGQRRLRSGS